MDSTEARTYGIVLTAFLHSMLEIKKRNEAIL
jgi:hypothetical protein